MADEIEALMLHSLRVRPQSRAALIGRLARQHPRILRDAIEKSLLRLVRQGYVQDADGWLFPARPILHLRRPILHLRRP